jgi:voltage-gated potassium channel
MLQKIRDHRHTAFLAVLGTTYLSRPAFGDSAGAQLAFSIFVVVILLMALLTVEADAIAEAGGDKRVVRRRWRRVAWLLAAIVIGERVESLVSPTRLMLTIGTISYLVFFAFVAASHFRTMLRSKHVTGETISMSISTYLLIALTWAMAFQLMFDADPSSFDLGVLGKDAGPARANSFVLFVSFSLGALSTNIVGDMAPVSLAARYATVVEGLIGQFYLAILVARLVGMQMASPPADVPPDRGTGEAS